MAGAVGFRSRGRAEIVRPIATTAFPGRGGHQSYQFNAVRQGDYSNSPPGLTQTAIIMLLGGKSSPIADITGVWSASVTPAEAFNGKLSDECLNAASFCRPTTRGARSTCVGRFEPASPVQLAESSDAERLRQMVRNRGETRRNVLAANGPKSGLRTQGESCREAASFCRTA